MTDPVVVERTFLVMLMEELIEYLDEAVSDRQHGYSVPYRYRECTLEEIEELRLKLYEQLLSYKLPAPKQTKRKDK